MSDIDQPGLDREALRLACERLKTLPPDRDLEMVLMAAEAAAAGVCPEDLFKMPSGAGHRSARTVFAKAERDRILREAVETFFAGNVQMAWAELDRYERVSWRRDQALASVPARLHGKAGGAFWRALKACGRAPGLRQLQKICAN